MQGNNFSVWGKTEKLCIPGQESTHIYFCKMDGNNLLKRTFYNILSYHRYMHESLTSQTQRNDLEPNGRVRLLFHEVPISSHM